ncbi:MAG: purine-binding chemotaxis protein CheW [Hyphomicrobiales bacterium]|nr:purine-binding chemotaxis protein CheW [Hyphomicrobiales bacterium]MCP5370407.1 purine-binding chemotaxis protein CheW [Hyphomicrobiales bacterium]
MSDDDDRTPRFRVFEGSGPGGREAPRRADPTGLMPVEPAEVMVLERRARALRDEVDKAEDVDFQAFVRVRLGSRERYGIPYRHVREVMPAGHIADVPGTPDVIRGVVNRRGELLTVLDLKQFFQVDRAGYEDDAAVVVATGAGLCVGILVDQVEGQDLFDPAKLKPPFPSDGIADLHHVAGIHEGHVTVLNMESLLSDPSIFIDDAS